LNYARSRGKADIVATLQGLAGKYGDRFKPDAGWDQFT
jgi:3-hydroxyacyl-CoA dehydrogenase/enoyl-CoA hydratase/3-hydroxybutyryl-CoA epimerase